MKTDRELLELAAKAAGIDARWSAPSKSMVLSYQNSCMEMVDKEWNPLTDDGDALRLAVKLGLWIHIGKYHTAIDGTYIEEIAKLGDSLAATRRAITRAAAEIQLQKEREQ